MQLSSRLRGRGGAIVLMYHSVADDEARQYIDPRNHVPPDVFEEQMAFLAGRRTVVSLTDLLSLLKRGRSADPWTVAITFDDGYLDNLETAAPILKRFNLPATFFLPTRYIDQGRPQWVDEAYYAFMHRSSQELRWDGNGEVDAAFDLSDASSRHEAYRVVCADLLVSRDDRRGDLIADLRRQLAPEGEPPSLTMTWDNVNELLGESDGFEVGGHTVGHTDLTNASEEDARAELRDCIDRIEQQTGRRPRHFSFPYGRATDRLRQLIAEAGFESACGGGGDPVVRADTNRYALPRVEAPASMRRFDLLTSTANTGFWRRLGR